MATQPTTNSLGNTVYGGTPGVFAGSLVVAGSTPDPVTSLTAVAVGSTTVSLQWSVAQAGRPWQYFVTRFWKASNPAATTTEVTDQQLDVGVVTTTLTALNAVTPYVAVVFAVGPTGYSLPVYVPFTTIA